MKNKPSCDSSVEIIKELFDLCCKNQVVNQHNPYSFEEINEELTARVYEIMDKLNK